MEGHELGPGDVDWDGGTQVRIKAVQGRGTGRHKGHGLDMVGTHRPGSPAPGQEAETCGTDAEQPTSAGARAAGNTSAQNPGSDPGAVWPLTWEGPGVQTGPLPRRVSSKFLAFTRASGPD